jgi:hypothetical protein
MPLFNASVNVSHSFEPDTLVTDPVFVDNHTLQQTRGVGLSPVNIVE